MRCRTPCLKAPSQSPDEVVRYFVPLACKGAKPDAGLQQYIGLGYLRSKAEP